MMLKMIRELLIISVYLGKYVSAMLVIRTLVKVETCSVLQKLKHLKRDSARTYELDRGYLLYLFLS